MELTADQRKAFHAALMSAFPDPSALRIFLDHDLDVRLDEISTGRNLAEIVYEIIKWYEARGWIDALIDKAHEANLGNPRLQEFYNRIREPLTAMPPVVIDTASLVAFGRTWLSSGERFSRSPPYSSGEFARLFDIAVGQALATMLGGIPIVTPNPSSLIPTHPDCVEVGSVRIIGGIRPTSFDVGYRPDGVRFVFNSKTLSDKGSIQKNWQNMINDLAIESTTVHSRFPHAIVAFMIVLPAPCASPAHRKTIIESLERLTRRSSVDGPPYMAEVMSLVLWNPSDGSIDPAVPGRTATLRLERFSEQVEVTYASRYGGLPPHDGQAAGG